MEAQPECFRDLNLDQVVAAIASRPQNEGLRRIFHTPSRDGATVRYRQEVFADLEDEAVLAAVAAFIEDIRRVVREIAHAKKLEFRCHRLIVLRDAVDLYCRALRRLVRELGAAAPHSEGLRAFGAFVDACLASDSFRDLESGAAAIGAKLGELRYGILIKSRGLVVRRFNDEPDYSAKILALFDRFRRDEGAGEIGPDPNLFWLNHIEAGILDRVGRLFPQVFAELEGFVRQCGDFVHPVVALFEKELEFYLAYRRFIAPLATAGLPFCFPVVSATDKRFLIADGFDLALAGKLVKAGSSPVLNSARLDDHERVFVVSGPNQGGKTTFARMFGQLHYLAGLGCPVPGRSARIFLGDGVFTHFERRENIADLRSKLEDDLMRVRDLYAAATSQSVIVLNEIFSSTTLDDQVFLSRKVLEGTMRLDVLAVCVTFIDELSILGPAVVSMVADVDPDDPVHRTFRISRRPADGLAHALSLAERHRVTRGQLRERLRR